LGREGQVQMGDLTSEEKAAIDEEYPTLQALLDFYGKVHCNVCCVVLFS
jgi:hypothetical protein